MTDKNTASQASYLETFENPVNPRTGSVEARFSLGVISAGLVYPMAFELALTTTRQATNNSGVLEGFGDFLRC